MKVGLLGFGVVGRGFYDITKTRKDIQVSKVVCLEDISLPDAEVTKDFQSIITDASIDTIVEAMGGLHPAYEFVRAAIEAGKNVVTSNKALVCTYYDELIPLAEANGVKFRCTAAVGGGICWLSELERSRRVQKIHQVGGIMNGTCNYILDSMARMGLGYDEALKQAQSLGYAEANPSTDVDGIDTWHKLILSGNIAFGVSFDTENIPVAGIRQITAEDVDNFKAHGYVCKLVSTGIHKDNKFSAYVQPTLFDSTEPESTIPTNYNLITLIGETSGRQSFFGQGAGRYPTAYNVVQDCVDLLQGKSFYTVYGPKVSIDNHIPMCYYIRGGKWPAMDTATYWENAIITKPTYVDTVHAWLKNNPDAFIAALPTKC